MHTQFEDIIILIENNGVASLNPDSIVFNKFLDQLKDEKNMDKD